MTTHENSDVLLNIKNKISSHNTNVVIVSESDKEIQQNVVYEPPDGSFRGYLVMICAFLCNGILFGIINTYSVIYMSLQKQLKNSGDELASSKACKFISEVRL